MKWYNFIYYQFSTTLNNNADEFSNDEIRQEMVLNYNVTTDSARREHGERYYKFVNDIVLPKVRRFQQEIRFDIR